MTIDGKNLKFLLLLFLLFSALTGCVAMGVTGVETYTVGLTAITASGMVTDDENIKVHGNYNDDHGYWFDKDKFFIDVEADSEDHAERVARELSGKSCQKREKAFSILELHNYRLRPPFASIFDNKYATEIQFKCTSETAKSDPSSILVSTEDQDSSEQLARELATEACQSEKEYMTIIQVDNYLRPISLLVLDKWYASNITFRCSNKANEDNLIEASEPQSTPKN